MAISNSQPSMPPVFRLRCRPSQNDVEKFRRHIRDTGCPETYPEITTSRPENLDGAEILHEFQIDRNKRPDRDEAPCPICSEHAPKFLSGYLVFFPEEMCIRAIGRECGSRLKHNWAKDIEAFKRRQRQEETEKYLEVNLPQVPTIVGALGDQLRKFEKLKLVWWRMKSKAPSLVQALRKAAKEGHLYVSEKTNHQIRTSTGSSRFVRKSLGLVRGQAVTKFNFDMKAKLEKELEQLRVFDLGSDPQDAFLAMCDMSLNERKATERAIKSAIRLLRKAEDQGADFVDFFDRENLGVLNSWGQHPSSQLGFRLTYQKDRQHLKVEVGGKETEFVSLKEIREYLDYR